MKKKGDYERKITRNNCFKIPTREKLTPEASCEPCLPSACGCAPWGCVCFWRRYLWPSGRDCGTYETHNRPLSIFRASGILLKHLIHWHINDEWGNSHLHVPVNFLWLPVATEKATQDSHSPHPYQFLRHTGVGCSLSFTWDGSKIKHRITTRKNKDILLMLGEGIRRSTHHNPCDVPCGGPKCSCGSEPGNEPSLVSWWSIHPSPVFGSAGLRDKSTQLGFGL